jgi:hypothetical protein
MLTTAQEIWSTIGSSNSLSTTWRKLALGSTNTLNEMCGMNLTIGRLIEKFPGNSSKKTPEHNLYHRNPTKGRLTIYASFVEAFW